MGVSSLGKKVVFEGIFQPWHVEGENACFCEVEKKYAEADFLPEAFLRANELLGHLCAFTGQQSSKRNKV